MTTSESKGRFFYKTNLFELIRITNRIESIRIANWNALLTTRLPSHIAVHSKCICWFRFEKKYCPDKRFFLGGAEPPSPRKLRLWRQLVLVGAYLLAGEMATTTMATMNVDADAAEVAATAFSCSSSRANPRCDDRRHIGPATSRQRSPTEVTGHSRGRPRSSTGTVIAGRRQANASCYCIAGSNF